MEARSIIAEIEGTFASGSVEKQAEIVRRVTDLFLAGADKYSDEQVDLFDGVISRIADRIEIKARVRAGASPRPGGQRASGNCTQARPR